jgi:beta-glucanase (GH16 family)
MRLGDQPTSDDPLAMFARLLTTASVLGVLAITPGVAAARNVRWHRPHRADRSRLVWSDEFNGPAGASPNPAKWRFDVGGGGWGNEELEYYTSRRTNASLDGYGHLVLTARRESYTAKGTTRYYTSARLKTQGLFSTTYGRLQARIELPSGRGLWPAFWAVGEDIESLGWPASGEIDVMESLGDPFTVYGSIHGPEGDSPRGYSYTTPHSSLVSLSGGFHVYGVDWSPAAIVFTLDGVRYATRTPTLLSVGQQWVFNKPFFLILDQAVGGVWPGAPTASTAFPSTMLVDWVRVYSAQA